MHKQKKQQGTAEQYQSGNVWCQEVGHVDRDKYQPRGNMLNFSFDMQLYMPCGQLLAVGILVGEKAIAVGQETLGDQHDRNGSDDGCQIEIDFLHSSRYVLGCNMWTEVGWGR